MNKLNDIKRVSQVLMSSNHYVYDLKVRLYINSVKANECMRVQV